MYMNNIVKIVNENEKKPPRMRTIPKAYEEIKKIDPDTSISMRLLRKLVNSGQIPTVKVSNKILINFDLLLDLLSCYNDNTTCA